MKKEEMKKVADKYGMEILRHHITRQGMGLQVRSEKLIPELEDLCRQTEAPPHVVCDRQWLADEYLYRVYTPKSWFDLWGWA